MQWSPKKLYLPVTVMTMEKVIPGICWSVKLASWPPAERFGRHAHGQSLFRRRLGNGHFITRQEENTVPRKIVNLFLESASLRTVKDIQLLSQISKYLEE